MTYQVKILAGMLLVFFVFVYAAPALAAPSWWPIVPCGIKSATGAAAEKCQRCDFLKLLKNLIDFVAFGAVPIIGGLLFVIAGAWILTAGANPGNFEKGKSILTSTIWGTVIIYSSWLITNTILVNFGDKINFRVPGKWYEFQCINPVDTAPIGPISLPVSTLCSNRAALAALYGTSATDQNSSALDTMISCFRSDPQAAALIDTNQIYTFERSRPICNSTRGNPVCGACQHAVASCHYGGNRSQSAEAVDFNAKGGREKELYQILVKSLNKCNAKWINFETSHTHITTKACDTGGVGLSGGK